MMQLVFFYVGLLAISSVLVSAEGVRSFPTAEGFGAYSAGGRGGEVLFVTTLADYLPGKERAIRGSLRSAVESKKPRTVIFQISGTIELRAPLKIKYPYITIAGQTAPGGGICLKNYGLSINTHDVVMRYIRCRPGDGVGRRADKKWETDAISIGKSSRNVILDHCSASWANDEVCSVSGEGVTDITVQWCMITESLNNSTHAKGRHGYGSLIRCNGNVSFHHNLYAFHQSRSPRPGTYGDGSILFDFRNNLMHLGGKGYSAQDPVRMNFISNYHPTTPFTATDTCAYFSKGNNGKISGGTKRKSPFAVATVITTSAETARDAILESCGAILPKRDAVDIRIVELIRANSGKLIDSVDDVGGWPELVGTPAPKDSDTDGMPDKWEIKHGLNPRRANNNDDSDKDGYTDIEEFLNGTEP